MSNQPGSYNAVVMDHFSQPRNKGEMKDPDGVGEATNPVCGDTMRLFIKVEGDFIAAATFLTFGCGAAIAASSMTTEMIKGKTVQEALTLTDQDVVHALGGLPPGKIHCSILAEKAIKAAVSNYQKKRK